MTSTLFFKGQWKVPFNKTATHTEAFYDEMRNQIGDVTMMYQTGPFPYARVDALYAHAVQLNYGKVCIYFGEIFLFVGNLILFGLFCRGHLTLFLITAVFDSAE